MRLSIYRLPFFLLALSLAASMWMYVQLVLIPHQRVDAAAKQIPRGNLSDLYPRWLGVRELLLHGRDPYADDVTREIQAGYYGRTLDPARPNDPKDQQGFAYPVYVVFLLAPIVKLPFAAIQPAFTWMLALLTGCSVLLWTAKLGFRHSRLAKASWIVLTLGCFPAIQGLKLQQLSLLVAFLIAVCIYAISRGRLVAAGLLLGVATIKPQLVALLAIALFAWAIGNWKQRQKLAWVFLVTVGLLAGGGEIVLPGWIGEFRAAMASYYRYTGGGRSVLDVLLSPSIGRIASAIVIAILLVLVWRMRRAEEGTLEFSYLISMTLASTLLVIPMFAPYNQLLLLPALILLVPRVDDLWRANRWLRGLVVITVSSIFWPFITAGALTLALLIAPPEQVQRQWALPLYTNFAIPITIWALLLASGSSLLPGREQKAAEDPDALPHGVASE